MSGPTTKTNWASYIPTLWAQRILEQVRASIVFAGLVNRDFENTVASLGDTVRITKVGSLSAVDKAAGTSVTRQNPASTNTDLVLNKHKIVPFLIEDVARAQAIPGAMDAQIAEAVRALVEQIDSDIVAEIVANAGSNVGTYGTDASEALLLLVRKALVDAKAPQGLPRHAVWATKDTNALMTTSSSKFTKVNESGTSAALRDASLGRLYTLENYESQLINVNAGSPNQTQCVAFTSPAVQFAMRPLPTEDSAAGVKSAVVSDPVSGLSVRIMSQYDINAVGLATNVDVLYGTKVVRAEHCLLVKT